MIVCGYLCGVGCWRATLRQFIVEQLGYGVLVGGGIGLAGGWLLGLARRRGWMAESFQQIGVVALPVLCLVVSEMAGASMFIAAFVAGLAVQIGFKEAGQHSVQFAEEWGKHLRPRVQRTPSIRLYAHQIGSPDAAAPEFRTDSQDKK